MPKIPEVSFVNRTFNEQKYLPGLYVKNGQTLYFDKLKRLDDISPS